MARSIRFCGLVAIFTIQSAMLPYFHRHLLPTYKAYILYIYVANCAFYQIVMHKYVVQKHT